MTNKPWTLERAAVLARQILQFVAVPGEEPGETRPPMTAVWSQMLNDVEQLEAVASSCVAAGAEDSKLRDAVVSYFDDPDAFTDWWNKNFDRTVTHPANMLLRWVAARQGEGTNG